MNAILSIKPFYVAQILRGEKYIEFRKQPFKQKIVKYYIYSTSPQKVIVAYFTAKGIVVGTAEDIWDTYGKQGAISKNDYYKYFAGKKNAVAIIIDKVVKIKPVVDPYRKIQSFTAPQSYRYINVDIEYL